jgi:hypothetical protein
MLQPAKRANRDLGVDRRGLAATTAIHKGEPDQTVQATQDSPTDTPAGAAPPLEERPMDPIRSDRENAPAPDTRDAMGLPESKLASSPTDEYPGVVRFDPTKSVH